MTGTPRERAVPLRRLLTNAEGLLSDRATHQSVEARLISEDASIAEIRRACRWLRDGDVLLVDTSSRLLIAAAIAAILQPRRRWRIVSLDLVLATPRTARARLAARLKGILYRRADLFILYFSDIAGYRRHYGIPADRVRHVPFKVNAWNAGETAVSESDDTFILCAGRSNRDVETFVKAVQLAQIPAVLLQQDAETRRTHGTPPVTGQASTLKIQLDSGGRDSWVQWLRRARAIVVPIAPGTIAPSGISTYLDAMGLGVPVIISECPAVNGMLTNEAVVVPAGDPAALAGAMRRVWEDGDLRRELVARGRAYAERCQGAERLHRDLLAAIFCGTESGSASPG